MKPSLVVLTPGKQEGKVIPILTAEFHIGRDPQCHLRPTNPVISKRHCVLLIRGDALVVRDLQSTNGTFVNDQRVAGEMALAEGDQLKVGPLLFGVRLGLTPVDRPTPLPPTKSAASPAGDDLEAVAAELLALNDDPAPAPAPAVPQPEPGSTTLMMTSPSELSGAVSDVPGLAAAVKENPSKKPVPSGDTSTAAKELLDKYLRRNKTR